MKTALSCYAWLQKIMRLKGRTSYLNDYISGLSVFIWRVYNNCVTQLKLQILDKLSSSIYSVVCEWVCQGSVTPNQIYFFLNIYWHKRWVTHSMFGLFFIFRPFMGTLTVLKKSFQAPRGKAYLIWYMLILGRQRIIKPCKSTLTIVWIYNKVAKNCHSVAFFVQKRALAWKSTPIAGGDKYQLWGK